jgi:hypothetical protein
VGLSAGAGEPTQALSLNLELPGLNRAARPCLVLYGLRSRGRDHGTSGETVRRLPPGRRSPNAPLRPDLCRSLLKRRHRRCRVTHDR